MSYDYLADIASARVDIVEHGRQFVAVYDVQSGDPWNPSVTESQTEFFGLQTLFTVQEVAAGIVAAGDIKILVAGNDCGAGVQTGTKIIDGAVEYRVKFFSRVAPGGITVLTRLHCER